MNHGFLIKRHHLLCFGIKILSFRSQQHPARHMPEQFKLQLPCQRADLLGKRRLRNIQCIRRSGKTVQFHNAHKTFQCAFIHSSTLSLQKISLS